jgi:uncharacterized lipoprotein YddW (UPF0748 family)
MATPNRSSADASPSMLQRKMSDAGLCFFLFRIQLRKIFQSSRTGLSLAAFSGLVATVLLVAPPKLTKAQSLLRATVPATEVRALWVVRETLTSREKIQAMVERAAAAGFNTLIVQVRGRGDAYYHSRWEPRAIELNIQLGHST